jgi:hypothetical protein
MRLRTLQLAFVMLLLSSLGAAETTTARDADRILRTTYIGVLLHQQSLAQPQESALSRTLDRLADATPSAAPAPRAHLLATPAERTTHVHAVTGSGL